MTGTNFTTLSADCKDGNGNLHPASLPDAWTCLYDISNNGGVLACQGRPGGSGTYITGPYKNSCTAIATVTDKDGSPRLTASCTNFFGNPQFTSLVAPDSCGSENIKVLLNPDLNPDDTGTTIPGPKATILNINGNLRCVVLFTYNNPGRGNINIIGKTVWKDSASTTHTYWTIDQPRIDSAFVNYPMMTYTGGDRVTLWAYGCAQRGGGFDSGDTWADYTNQPSSGEYAGLAVLSGMNVGSLSRSDPNPGQSQIGPFPGFPPVSGGVTGFNGQTLTDRQRTIADGPDKPASAFLILGYVDDGFGSGSNNGYPDNGYYTHDNGNGACTTVPPVAVNFQVDHPLDAAAETFPYAVPTDPKPFDIVFNQLDQNGLPQNPTFYSQYSEHDKKPAPALPNFGDDTLTNPPNICGPAFSTPAQYTASNAAGDIASVAAGAAAGAAAGSVVPVVGTAIGSVVGALGGWLFGNDVAASTATTMDTTKLQASCTSQYVAIDQYSATSNWGSAILGAGDFGGLGGLSQICPANPIRGHLNWEPVTYSGWLHLSDWSGVFPQDSDVNMSLVPGTAADNGNTRDDDEKVYTGLTLGSANMRTDDTSESHPYGGFLLEFDTTETLERYFKSDWWQPFAKDALAAGPSSFSDAAGSPPPSKYSSQVETANRYLFASDDPKETAWESSYSANAVVTGLMGIDGVHDGGISELHPVYSMAVHLASKDVQDADGLKETWAFFIRNQGDEGNCSSDTHTLEPEALEDASGQPPRDYYISLPWPADDAGSHAESVSGSFNASPWVTGSDIIGVDYTPGAGTYLHFQSPPYSTEGEVPFFGYDGTVVLSYKYAKAAAPKAEPHKAAAQAADIPLAPSPAGTDKGASPAAVAKDAAPAKPDDDKDSPGFDGEDFPWQKILASGKDPAVAKHLKKYFSPPQPAVVAGRLPDLVKDTDGKPVDRKKLLRDAKLPRRTNSTPSLKIQHRVADFYRNAGYSPRTFQAIDAQHVFFIGDDGALRLTEGPFNSNDAAKANSSKLIDQDTLTFQATATDKVFVLNNRGNLVREVAPFEASPDGTCATGFVWRAAFKDDHACVSPITRDEAAADNAAAKSHTDPAFLYIRTDICIQGYVWRQANPDDHVCVTPETRAETRRDNALAPSRIAGASARAFLAWPVAKFQVAADESIATLDPKGELWNVPPHEAASLKPALLAQSVREFQVVDGSHRLLLTTDDKLQADTTGVAVKPAPVNNVWTFQQTADGSLYVVDADSTLWKEAPQQQIETNVRKFQALDATNLLVLGESKILSLYASGTGAVGIAKPAAIDNNPTAIQTGAPAPVVTKLDSNVLDFQAIDAGTFLVLDDQGQLWLERYTAGTQAPAKMIVATHVK